LTPRARTRRCVPQGYLAHTKTPPPKEPTIALCLGPYGGPRGWAFSYVRGSPGPLPPTRWTATLLYKVNLPREKRLSGHFPHTFGQVPRRFWGCRNIRSPPSGVWPLEISRTPIVHVGFKTATFQKTTCTRIRSPTSCLCHIGI